MRDYILVYINGQAHEIRAEDAFLPLTDFLRGPLAKCGTKVVCAEGDCGACTVAIGRAEKGTMVYKPVNGCIQLMFQLDCTHVITVEGVGDPDAMNPVQKAMVECHGAQCGFCTPGFVMAMCSLFDSGRQPNRQAVKDGLSGNLCRCTGYVSIIDSALSVQSNKVVSFNRQYPPEPLLESFARHQKEDVQVEFEGRTAFLPATIEQAVAFKKKHPRAAIISGGTDVCVNINKRNFEPEQFISTAALAGLDELRVNGAVLEIGARVTLRALEHFVKDLIPELYDVLFVFGSPQIRYAATLAGNIANASPISDTLPFLYVMDAELEVVGTAGARRIKIQSFYKGYKDLALESDELITRIFLPLPKKTDLLRLYKVSRREHLDISSFAAAIRMSKDDEDKIVDPVIAYGGVGPVIIRMRKTEEFLTGKTFSLESFAAAGSIACQEIKPLSDMRGSSDFRYQLAKNILLKYFHETMQEKQLVCR
jgi:xanthine dehydrogenase small subunit